MNAASEQQKDFSVFIAHHFMYAKETRIPAGVVLDQHRHKFDHYSLLISGVARVVCDGKAALYQAPALITIEANKVHSVTAITDVEWWCVHETDERDVSKIDMELVA